MTNVADRRNGVVSYGLDDDGYGCSWTGIITGPRESDHEGRQYQVKLFLDEDFPEKPPSVRFHSLIRMSGVNGKTGVVNPKKFDVLANWQPEYTIGDILTHLKEKMAAPHNQKLGQPREGENGKRKRDERKRDGEGKVLVSAEFIYSCYLANVDLLELFARLGFASQSSLWTCWCAIVALENKPRSKKVVEYACRTLSVFQCQHGTKVATFECFRSIIKERLLDSVVRVAYVAQEVLGRKRNPPKDPDFTVAAIVWTGSGDTVEVKCTFNEGEVTHEKKAKKEKKPRRSQ
ncbi:hypothetical protein QN277_013037 [Acacia crassicarpa]|uniref:UBC core domain-containing protein n=1 Tax=Acacia crassicarpa TaxID=499986 RepID=A0AAE1N2G8_9FABA|nr:hypothetical protein QN277_013037 [Acacia crassicarpa]